MRTIEINGRTFELVIPKEKYVPAFGSLHQPKYGDIFDAYDRPSQTKINIWKSWVDWAYATGNLKSFVIYSYNCMNFSIRGLYTDKDGKSYNLWITKAHNRAILVNG